MHKSLYVINYFTSQLEALTLLTQTRPIQLMRMKLISAAHLCTCQPSPSCLMTRVRANYRGNRPIVVAVSSITSFITIQLLCNHARWVELLVEYSVVDYAVTDKSSCCRPNLSRCFHLSTVMKTFQQYHTFIFNAHIRTRGRNGLRTTAVTNDLTAPYGVQ